MYIANLYDLLATSYIDVYGWESAKKYYTVLDLLQQYLCELHVDDKALVVLDAGSGIGIGLFYMSSLKINIYLVGVDVSRRSCQLAHTYIPNCNADIVVSVLEMLPFRENSFDMVVAVSSLDLDSRTNLKLQLHELRRVSRAVNLYITPGQDYSVWVERKR